MKKTYAIGIDIGGSHISAVLIDAESECILTDSFSTKKVNNKDSAENILAGWASAIDSALWNIKPDQLLGIGFAMPGPFDYENGIALFEKVAKYESLYGINIGEELRPILGLDRNVPFRFINDAISFAVGESWVGNAREYNKIMAITLGTGFGSAFVQSGIPILEGDDVPKLGCLWHLPYKDGTADDYFSTRWFIQSCEAKTGRRLPGVREIAEFADTNGIARELFEEFGTCLGVFLAPWIKKFKAESLIVGGNMTGAYELFGPFLEDALKRQQLNINVVRSELMETAAMLGSARLMNEDFWINVKPLLSKM